MPSTGVCSLCSLSSVTTLSVHLSIDCATSSYAGVQTRIAFCQPCLDQLGGLGNRRLTRRALRAAAKRALDMLDEHNMEENIDGH